MSSGSKAQQVEAEERKKDSGIDGLVAHFKEKGRERAARGKEVADGIATAAVTKAGALAGAGETVAVKSRQGSVTNITPPRFLHSLSFHEFKKTPTEQILKMSPKEGVAGLVDMRVYGAAPAARLGRMDLLTYFIEERKVAVNTITKEERAITDKLPGAESLLKQTYLITPLFAALISEQETVITYLLNRMRKAETETRGLYGRTCLAVAAKYGNLGAARRLVMEFDADYTIVRCDDNHSICYAVQQGHVPVVDFFLEHARSIGKGWRNELRDDPCPHACGFPLMYRAICSDQLPVVQYIAEKEGKKHFIDVLWKRKGTNCATSPLHVAAGAGKLDIVKWLCEQGASVNFTTLASKSTPLHFACDGEEDNTQKMVLVVKYLV